jgi:hypothetical protein
VPSEAVDGKVNCTLQCVTAAEPLFVIVNFPWYPLPQSESFEKVAVRLAVDGLVAATATPTPPPAANNAVVM